MDGRPICATRLRCALWTLGLLTLVSGCPWDAEAATVPSTDAGFVPVPDEPTAGDGVHESSSDVDAGWNNEELAPVPSDEVLCMLRFTTSNQKYAGSRLSEVKMLLGGEPQESQSMMQANLQYRFSSNNKLGLCGINFTFDWRSNFGPQSEAAGGVVTIDYYLGKADVQGMPYPNCWPRPF